MSRKLLICIAFHFNETRYKYLKAILDRFLNTYQIDLKILIDTNSAETEPLVQESFPAALQDGRVEVCLHENLEHPHHLTWCHRFHFQRLLDSYDYFYYTEDDMDLPWENFLFALEQYPKLWPHAIPGFLRVEEKGGEWFSSDTTYTHYFPREGLKNFPFMAFQPEYHAAWLMPRDLLKNHMKPNFARWQSTGRSRELAASYPNWELRKRAVVHLEQDGKISKRSWIYHLPNNYANTDGVPQGKLRVSDLIQLV